MYVSHSGYENVSWIKVDGISGSHVGEYLDFGLLVYETMCYQSSGGNYSENI
jgi:hypothetical protein